MRTTQVPHRGITPAHAHRDHRLIVLVEDQGRFVRQYALPKVIGW